MKCEMWITVHSCDVMWSMFDMRMLSTNNLCFFVYFFAIDKLLETTDSMHRLMREKSQLVASLLEIPHDDYESVTEVWIANCNCWLLLHCEIL